MFCRVILLIDDWVIEPSNQDVLKFEVALGQINDVVASPMSDNWFNLSRFQFLGAFNRH